MCLDASFKKSLRRSLDFPDRATKNRRHTNTPDETGAHTHTHHWTDTRNSPKKFVCGEKFFECESRKENAFLLLLSPKEREIKTRPSWSAAWQATELGLGKQAAANRARRFSLWRYPLSSLFELWRHDSNAHKDRRRRRGDRQTGLWSGGVPGYMFQRFYFIFFWKLALGEGEKKIYRGRLLGPLFFH